MHMLIIYIQILLLQFLLRNSGIWISLSVPFVSGARRRDDGVDGVFEAGELSLPLLWNEKPPSGLVSSLGNR